MLAKKNYYCARGLPAGKLSANWKSNNMSFWDILMHLPQVQSIKSSSGNYVYLMCSCEVLPLCEDLGGLVLSLKSRVKLCFIRMLFKLCTVTNGLRPSFNATDASSATPLGYHFISFNNSCRATYNWYNTILVVGLWDRIAWFMPLSMDFVLNLPRPIYWF